MRVSYSLFSNVFIPVPREHRAILRESGRYAYTQAYGDLRASFPRWDKLITIMYSGHASNKSRIQLMILSLDESRGDPDPFCPGLSSAAGKLRG